MRIGTQGDHFGVSGDRTWKREHYCGRRNRIHEYRAVHDGTGAMGTAPGQSSFDRWYVSRRFLLSAFGIGHGRDRRKSRDDVQDFTGSTRRIFLAKPAARDGSDPVETVCGGTDSGSHSRKKRRNARAAQPPRIRRTRSDGRFVGGYEKAVTRLQRQRYGDRG